MLTTKQAIDLYVSTKMKPFEEQDFSAFAGVESENPTIGYGKDGEILIEDGDRLVIFDKDGEEHTLRIDRRN